MFFGKGKKKSDSNLKDGDKKDGFNRVKGGSGRLKDSVDVKEAIKEGKEEYYHPNANPAHAANEHDDRPEEIDAIARQYLYQPNQEQSDDARVSSEGATSSSQFRR